MISVSLESNTIWAKQSSRFFITVRNSGPEDLYCSDEEFEPSGKSESYIMVSCLTITPKIGDMEEALVADKDDIVFEVLEQPENGRHFQLWVCMYSNGILRVKPNEGIACLPKKSRIKIQADIKGIDIHDGPGLLNYKFRDWTRYDTVKAEYMKMAEEDKELWVTKVPAPFIEFAPKSSYTYGQEAFVAWKVKDTGEDMGEVSVTVNGQIQSLNTPYEGFYEGELSLLMKDEPHVLEFRSEFISRGLKKKFWPAWFEMKRSDSPKKKIPEKNDQIILWWNIPEAAKCKVQKIPKPAHDITEVFRVEHDETEVILSYYDEDNYEKELKILYTKPYIDVFSFGGKNVLAGNLKMDISGFVDPEVAGTMDAAVNAIYGGDSPWTSPPEEESLFIKAKCQEGDCYFSINEGKIWTMTREEQERGKNISVPKKSSYHLELWDSYGCKVKGVLTD